MSVRVGLGVRGAWVGRHVLTPDGEGVVCAVERGGGWGLGDPVGVRVGFGFPVAAERAVGRKVERVMYLYEVEPKPAAAQRESVAEFMARRHDPSWRAPRLPGPRRLPRLSEERFEALMREQGAARLDAGERMGA
ncbi:hypothetical protein G3N18_15610 [Microbacterium sp. 2C]|uniref:hypothetical protein n=1 Tax=Microbacterium paulum TaxID=2707006 RepID=UPI0018C33F4F|nr:hypothetical protein [Microbacterium paulum]MBG0719456.1 hypothetical protein [Microbacterium paulum]